MPSKTKEQADTLCGTAAYKTLSYRDDSDLPYLTDAAKIVGPLLLDTTVYINAMKDQLEPEARTLLAVSKDIYHSSVSIAELKTGYSALDPADTRTSKVRAAMQAVLDDIPGERIITPSHDDWSIAGVMTGRLGRQRNDNYKDLMNDALILATAQRHGMTVLTANAKDFDLLTQLSGGGLLLYRQVKAPNVKATQ